MICELTKETDAAMIILSAKEKYPLARVRIISDNGSQFIVKYLKKFILVSGISHASTSVHYLKVTANWSTGIKL